MAIAKSVVGAPMQLAGNDDSKPFIDHPARLKGGDRPVATFARSFAAEASLAPGRIFASG